MIKRRVRFGGNKVVGPSSGSVSDMPMNFNNSQLYRHLFRIFCGWVFFAAIVAAFVLAGIKMTRLSVDPAELAGYPIYYGLLSNLGMVVWGAGAFSSLFASFHVKDPKPRNLFRWAGILTLILLLDNLLLIHDEIFPNVLLLPEGLVYLFYLVTFSLLIFCHRNVILRDAVYGISMRA